MYIYIYIYIYGFFHFVSVRKPLGATAIFLKFKAFNSRCRIENRILHKQKGACNLFCKK